MLSINSSTSFFSVSLKYSAIVRAESATLILTPGVSFICPKTRAVLSDTPLSCISLQRSFPSLLRSPTPANTEYPPCSMAMLCISSCISTVLPTPAPPNRPIFPPFGYGSNRSMTFIPVSSISTTGLCCSKSGAFLWISHLSWSSGIGAPPSIGIPRTLNILPRVHPPTGTLMQWPSDLTSMSMDMSSLEASMMQRTTPFPTC